MRSGRLKVFAIVCAGGLLLAGGYVAFALWRVSGPPGEFTAPLSAPPARPYLMVLSTASNETFRKVLLAPLASPAGPGYATTLTCARMSFAGNRGVCMTQEGVIPSYYADIFDESFRRVHRVALTGLPSRTRLSPDGRRAAVTVFEQGHSYAEPGGFSTRTTILDTSTGQAIGDLEQFTITREGKRFQNVDFNFWGVTFGQDGSRFFATLATGDDKFLVEGQIDQRAARVLRNGVECPALSPDNTRIVYKSMISKAGVWRLRMYDLRTGTDSALAEARSVDDQVDWLDEDHIVYQLSGETSADVWVLDTRSPAAPAVLRAFANSPAIVR